MCHKGKSSSHGGRPPLLTLSPTAVASAHIATKINYSSCNHLTLDKKINQEPCNYANSLELENEKGTMPIGGVIVVG